MSESLNNNYLEALWQPGGQLAQSLTHYCFREGQQQMASAFARKLEAGGQLVVEAAAGTGKTYAYLLPLLLQNERRVVIASSTKVLQDQLYARDIPQLSQVLAMQKRLVLLKGRNNYLCPYFAEYNTRHSRYVSSQQRSILHAVLLRWQQSHQGELDKLLNSDQLELIKPMATASHEECIGQSCRYYKQCPFLLMRDKVHRADIVITNHTLLVRELLCESPTENSWLSEQDIVVIDEAHQLADCVDNTLAEFWSSYQCMSILRDLQPVIIRSFADQQVIREACNYSIKIIQRLSQIPFGDEYTPVSKNLLAKLLRGLVKLERHLFVQQQRDRQLRTIIPRLQRSLKTLKHWLILENEMSDQYVTLLDRRGKSLHLQLFPVAYGSQIESRLQEFHSVLFTSATLLHGVREDKLEAGRVVTSLADDVKTVRKLVFAGQNAEYLVCAPPFDYARQVVRFQPDVEKLPDEEGYLEAVLESLLPLLTMPAGKFLFLVTSHTARAKLIRLMQPFFGDHLYIAGAGDKIKTMKSFQSADSGVLLATASFREGVDLADCGLSGIVIDRLPFDSPADHLLMARAKKCRDQDVFINYQLPRAVQRLRQAFGRLIRRESDRGVFIVADPRLQRRWYGSVFLDGLPVMKLVPDVDAVRLFLSASD